MTTLDTERKLQYQLNDSNKDVTDNVELSNLGLGQSCQLDHIYKVTTLTLRVITLSDFFDRHILIQYTCVKNAYCN